MSSPNVAAETLGLSPELLTKALGMKQEQDNSNRQVISSAKNMEYMDALIQDMGLKDQRDDKNFRQQLTVSLLPYILGNKAQDLSAMELTVGPDGKETRNTTHRWLVDTTTGKRVAYIGTSGVINPPAPHETPGQLTADQRINNEEDMVKTAKNNAMLKLKLEYPNGIVTGADGSMSFATGPDGAIARQKYGSYLTNNLDSYVTGGLVSQRRSDTEKAALGIASPKADYVWDPVQKKLVPAK